MSIPISSSWFKLSPTEMQRPDGLKVTVPDLSIWPIELLGECPFVAEVMTYTATGIDRHQRPLKSTCLSDALDEADERFPACKWLRDDVVHDPHPKMLSSHQPESGWHTIPSQGLLDETTYGDQPFDLDEVKRKRNRVVEFKERFKRLKPLRKD